MPRINLLTATTLGVDGKTNPLFLGNKKLHWATNLSFEEGVIRTRPGIRYGDPIAQGQFQGAGEYRPSMGLSSAPFAEDSFGLVVVVDGNIYIGCDKVSPQPFFKLKGNVEIFQAENYLIFQNAESSTFWWDGETLTASPGMQEQDWNDPDLPRTEAEVIRPVGLPGTCGGYGEGGGGGQLCDNQGTVTFSVLNNLTEAALAGVTYQITVNGNVAYEGSITGQSTLTMEEGVYDYTFNIEGYGAVSGVVAVLHCQDQSIDVRLTPTEGGGGGGTGDCSLAVENITVGGEGEEPTGEFYYTANFDVVNTGTDDVEITEIFAAGYSSYELDSGAGGSVVPALPYILANGTTERFSIIVIIDGSAVDLLSAAGTVKTDCEDISFVFPDVLIDPPP